MCVCVCVDRVGGRADVDSISLKTVTDYKLHFVKTLPLIQILL